MDFRQISQPGQSGASRPAAPTGPIPTESEHKPEKGHASKSKHASWLQLFNGFMLIAIAILVALVALAMSRSNSNETPSESKYVAAGKYQAVFLNNEQVYFGNIVSMDSDYIRMTDVYYPTKNAETSNDYTLIKLGCQQIHYPYDQIVINRAQVSFWENLHDDGKVVQTIKDYQTANPDGPDCTQTTSSTQTSTNTTTQTDTTKK